ncbi:MAG: hypothetical protein WA324_14565 [Bryobacteraceae bacterium]
MSAASVSLSAIKKTKMVSFRLSHDEYRLLQAACAKAGARSVSELARWAMQRIILEAGLIEQGSTDNALRELQLKFSVLSAEVERLSRIVKESR